MGFNSLILIGDIVETKHMYYNFNNSLKRIDEILDSSDNDYEEKGTSIPSRNNLTFTNGFYVDVSAIFVDIRDSSSLSEIHRRPTLAKIYRSFISEVVAIMNGDKTCHEINIVGDCVSGIFETKTKGDIDNLISLACRIYSLIEIINCKLSKKNIQNIKVGIGIDDGRALMIKAGYKGSEINEIVWMGDVVNSASKLCNSANRYNSKQILISSTIYNMLNEYNRGLFNWNYSNSCYETNAYNIEMNEWLEENCGK